jgi:hypothetical protein
MSDHTVPPGRTPFSYVFLALRARPPSQTTARPTARGLRNHLLRSRRRLCGVGLLLCVPPGEWFAGAITIKLAQAFRGKSDRLLGYHLSRLRRCFPANTSLWIFQESRERAKQDRRYSKYSRKSEVPRRGAVTCTGRNWRKLPAVARSAL